MANSLSNLADNLAEANEKSKKRFKNTFKLSDNLINIFILLLRKILILMSAWINGKNL